MGSLLDRGGSGNAGSCGRSSSSSRAETGDFELNDGVGAAANGAAGDLGKKREQGSLDKRCFLAENATAFRSTSTTGSATGGHEESSFRRFSQLDVL
jgi:hypothetical protein